MSYAQKQKARAWVNGNSAAGVAVVVAAAPLPGVGTLALITQEVAMAYYIGGIYKADFSHGDAKAVAAAVGLGTVAGKLAAFEAASLAGPFAYLLKPPIAAGIIKGLGEAIISYCENKWG